MSTSFWPLIHSLKLHYFVAEMWFVSGKSLWVIDRFRCCIEPKLNHFHSKYVQDSTHLMSRQKVLHIWLFLLLLQKFVWNEAKKQTRNECKRVEMRYANTIAKTICRNWVNETRQKIGDRAKQMQGEKNATLDKLWLKPNGFQWKVKISR